MPTTSPLRSTSGPPELPGLIAASVWIAGYVVLWLDCCGWPGASCPSEELIDTGRFVALTMPLVTVASRPNGEPIATTFSPTAIFFAVLIVAGRRPETPSALMTARSVTGSVPTTRALAALPSLKLTDISPCSPATEATWLLVRISPSELMMMPEPEPCSCALRTLIFTTEGSTDFATASTESDAGAPCLRSTTGELVAPERLGGVVADQVAHRGEAGRTHHSGDAAHEQRGDQDRRRPHRPPDASAHPDRPAGGGKPGLSRCWVSSRPG